MKPGSLRMPPLFAVLVAVLSLVPAVTGGAEPLLRAVREVHLDDLDAMIERREVRALVSHSRINYEVEQGRQKGLIYDVLVELERALNRDFAQAVDSRKGKKGKRKATLPIRVTIIPVPYDKLYSELNAGRGDFVAGHMLVNEGMAKSVDFTEPFYDKADVIVVTRKGHPIVGSLQDLSGRTIYLRKSSGYYRALLAINEEFARTGKAEMKLVAADEHLADDELLEMVSAGLVPAVVTYQYRAALWAKVFKDLEVNDKYPVVDDGKIAWAVRKESPRLLAYLNNLVSTHKVGTTFGNMQVAKYFGSPAYARNALDETGRMRFDELVGLFRRYAQRYEFDHLLLMAQGYQESGLNQRARSRVGAIGVMQVMPATGKSLKVGNIRETEANIHAGTKYLDVLRDKYFNDPEIDELNRVYFTFAAYNAGPGNIRKMRALAKAQGLDPNAWFDNVELVTLQHIGREPVQYVSNISKYYLAYRMYNDNVANR